MFFAKQHHKKGFTLAETILVVAIIAILLAVAAPNVLAYYRQLKLTGLDDDAKTIFMAAQSRLTAMLSAGEDLKPTGTPANSFGEGSYTETPTAGGAAGGAGDPKVDFWYIDTDYSDLHNYVPGGSIESQLQDNKFVVEFNPDTGAVYAVWYWESDNDNFTYNPTYFEDDISRDTRLDKMVGYYGGSEVSRPELGQLPIPQLNIINAEELRLEIRIPSITGESGNGYNNTNLKVDVFINGKAIIKDAQLSDVNVKDPNLRKDSVGKVILDTLKPGDYSQDPKDDDTSSVWSGGWVAGAKFKDWNSSKSIGAVPGDDIDVTVTVKYTATLDDGKQLLAQSASVSTNSLFAGLEGGNTALIAYGRHLQNLHDSNRNTEFCSGVYSNSDITSAKQIRDINFYKTAESDEDPIYYWGSTYKKDGGGTGYDAYEAFHPISNANILKFDGDIFEIRNMCTEDDNGASGLFSSVYNEDNTVRFCNITIVNPNIHGHSEGGRAGALASDVFNKTRVIIDNCKVYVDFDEKKDIPDWEARFDDLELDDLEITENVSGKAHVELLDGLPHIGAPEDNSSAGGLIGTVWADSTVEISDSFSSISVIGENCVGGLVGNVGDGVSINIGNSYSASFLFGKHFLGGFLGHVAARVNLNLTNSYVAGEIKLDMTGWPVAAGFFTREDTYVAHVENCYSAVKYDGTTGKIDPDHGGQVYGTYRGDDTAKNYYIADPDITAGYGNQEGGGTVKCGNKVSAADLIAKFESQSGWTVDIAKMVENGTLPAAAAAGGDKQTTFTHAYNLLDGMNLQVYPYPMLTTEIDVVDGIVVKPDVSLPLEHYGDWVEGEDTPSATMVYYELTVPNSSTAVADASPSAYGFYKNEDGSFKTTPESGLHGVYVIEDGYALSYPNSTDVNLIPEKIKIDGEEHNVDKTSSFASIGDNKLYRIEGIDGVKRDRYYHLVEVPVVNTASSEVNAFWFNPDLACEVFPAENKAVPKGTVDASTAPIQPKAKTETGADVGDGVAVVRSARQLAQLGINTNAGTDYSKMLQKLKYEQKMDIDFDEYNQYVASSTKPTLPEIKDNSGSSSPKYNHVPITLVGESDTVRAEYNGNGHKVINMLPGAIVADGLAENGMFAKVKYADISGIEIINGRVVTNGDKNAVMGDGSSGSSSGSTSTKKYVLESKNLDPFSENTKSDGEELKVDDYFTILWSTSSKVDANTKSWTDGYSSTQRINFAGKADTGKDSIKFVTSGKATVKIWWVTAEANRECAILDSTGNVVYQTNESASRSAELISTATLSSAGTYYLGGLNNKNYIYKVEVTEEITATTPAGTPTEKPDGADIGSAKVRAGMLAGVVDNSTVTNCGAYVDYVNYKHQSEQADAFNYHIVKNAYGSNDYVGGLIGNVTESSVSSSYSAVKVLGVTYVGGFAGRLAGSTKDTVIEDCYSGGHTDGGTYYTTDPKTSKKTVPMKNVSATSEKDTGVGGFVGLVSNGGKVFFKGVNYTTSSVAIEKDPAVSEVRKPATDTDPNDPQVNYMTTGTSIGVFIGRVEYGAQIDTGTGNNKAINYATGTLFAKDSVVKRNATVKFVKNSSNKGYAWDDDDDKWVVKDEASVQYVTADEEYINEKVTMLDPRTAAAGSTDVDDSYDDLGDVYPYMRAGHVLGDTSKEIVHHGDWTNRLDFIYYEVYYPASGDPADIVNIDESTTGADIQKYIDDGTIGIYGMLRGQADPVNTLRHDDSIVYDSGYMVVNVDKDDLGPVDIQLRSVYTKEGENNKNHYNSEMIMESKHITSAKASWANYVYIVPFSVLNIAPSDHYYMMVYVNGVTYVFNPHFAGEAINVDLIKEENLNEELDLDTVHVKKGLVYDESTRKWEDTKNVVIRSAWNFASIARYSRESNNGVVRKVIRGKTFLQQMNIDYTKYRDGRIYDGNDNNRVKVGSVNQDRSGSSYIYGNIPILLDRGTYEGNNKTIKNIYLSNDSSANRYVGLFGSVLNGSKIHDLYVENVYLDAAKASTDTLNNATNKYEGVYMGVIAAYVDGNSEIMNVHVKNAEFDLHKVPEIKEVTNNNKKEYDWNYGPNTVKIKAIGGIVGELIYGKVENSDVDTLSINLNSGKYYYKGDKAEKEDDARNTLKVYKKEDGSRPNDATEAESVVDSTSIISIGGAIGEIDCSGTGARASVTNVTVIDPTITANRGKDNKVGGFVGSVADSGYAVYSNTATGVDDTRPAVITDCGVYISEGKKADFDKMGVIANGEPNGRTDGGDKVGGFAGYLGLGANVTGDYSAIRVQGIKYAGGFAGHIKGSHVEDCYSGGYVKTDGTYDTNYNVVADTSDGTAGGFVGKIEVAYKNGGSGDDPMAMYMTGINYTTSSVSGKNVGLFAGDGTNEAAEALAAKMGDLKPTNYAGGTSNVTARKESTVKIKSAMPRKDKGADFKTITYNANKDTFPFDTNLSEHHGDWVEYDLMTAGYWEVEDGKLRIYYIPSDLPDSPQERMESGCSPFDHDGRHTDTTADGITAAGYFAAWTDNSGSTYSLSRPTSPALTENAGDVASRIQTLLGGSTITVKAYDNATSAIASYETWQIKETGGTTSSINYYVNPAYGMAIEINSTVAGNMGKENKPYAIRTAQQLDNADGSGMYFRQTHDVAGKEYNGYTPNTLSGGEYDGGSYRILDLNIEAATGSDNAALFSALENGARVVNTILYGTDGKGVISGENAAGIAASINGGSIKNTIVAGYTITGKTVGGLAAKTTGAVSIANSEATVRREVSKAGGYIGGLVGQVVSDTANTTKISNSYAGGDVVTASGVKLNSGMTYLGGIVGGRTDGTDLKNVEYDTVYSYVAMIKGTGEGKLDFDDEKIKVSGKDTSDFKYVTFYGIGPDVDTDQTDTIGFWSGGIPDPNTDDRALNTALVNLTKWHTNEAKEVYMPNADDYVDGANALTNIASTTPQNRPFPYGGYVKDAEGNPIHYGDWPVAERYAGLFYWEQEKITDKNGKATTRYNFYAYGAELVRDQLFESDLLEDICHEHHFNERATILESGYGYFLPTASVGATTSDFKFSVMKGSDDVTNSGSFEFDDETSPTVTSIKAELFKKLQLEHTTDGYVVKILNGSGNVNINKFAEVKDYMWKITAKVGSEEKTFDMRVYPTFGEAIYGDDFNMGDGNDDNVDEVEPMKIRTRLQFERLKANADNKSLDYIRLTHDIDFAETTAVGYRAGVDECTFVDKTKTNYVPGQLRTQIFDGQGYRLFDVMISVNNKAESKNYEIDDLVNYHHTDEIEVYNNPNGDAALFLNSRDSNVTTFKGIVLYSPENKGVIETSVKGGSAAGIVAKEVKDYISYNYDKNEGKEVQKKTQSKYGFDNCVVSGYTIKGSAYVGGLVGMAVSSSNEDIKDSQTYVNLVGTDAKSIIGGLAGEWRTSIQNSYTGGAIKLEGATATTSTVIGGIVGNMPKSNSIKDCYTYMNFLDSSINAASVYPLGKGTSGGDNNYYYGEFTKGLTNLETDKQGTEAAKLQDLVDAVKPTADVDYSYWPETKADYYGYVSDAMGTFPFRAVAYVGEKDAEPKTYVHYGQWPESAKAAGVAYYEKYEDGSYGLQILGLNSDGTELNEDTLCDGKHVDSSGKITEHRIVGSGYAVFTTDPVNMPVSDLTLTVGTDDGARKAIADAVNGIFTTDGIKIYPTGKSGDTDNHTATVTADGDTRTVYYTNGFAGVSTSEMGTSTSQIKIRTVRQLDNIPDSCGKYFQQTHDLYGEDYNNGGAPKYTGVNGFSGTYDGGSYRILELSMVGNTTDTEKDVGLFRSASGTIKNVMLYSPEEGTATITNNSRNDGYEAKEYRGTGGIVGRSSGNTLRVTNCIVAGYKITGCDAVGGIVGHAYYGTKVTDCVAVNELCGKINKSSTSVVYARGIGGIIGASDVNSQNNGVTVSNCYAGGKITDAGSDTIVGGIFGFDARNATAKIVTVEKSYSYVDLSGNTSATAANIYVIGKNLNTSTSTGNYYLNEKIPSGCNTDCGDGLEFAEIEAKASGAKAERTYVPGGDGLTPSSMEYPFPAVVKDEGNGNKLVHYGALPVHEPISQATKGFFYWENHNGDYHVQYIGENESGEPKEADGLCTGRDGVGIEESGFGYFSLGEKATTTNAGTEITETTGLDKLNGITEALRNSNDVYSKVKVTAFETGTTGGDAEWEIGGFKAHVDQRFAKVYKDGEQPKSSGPAYEIRTIEQLSNIDSLNPSKEIKNYKFTQMHDLKSNTAVDAAYTPAYLSTGSEYDGQGYRILELSISKANGDYTGLFSRVKGTVKNVVLYSPSGNATIKNGKNPGGIAGELNGGTIENCVVAGYTITAGSGRAGGIVGYMNDSSTITKCQAVNVLDGGGDAAGIGGILGGANSTGTITNCYAGGKVVNAKADSTLKSYVGGIYGGNRKLSLTASYTYVDLTNIGTTNYDGRLCSIGYDYSGSDCYYLASEFPTNGTAQGSTLGASTTLTGFSTVNSSYAPEKASMDGGVTCKGLTAMTDNFPYPAIFTPDNGGTHEHYGTWLTTTSGAPGMPEGPSFEGMMSAAVPEGLMPEVLALPVNELAGEPVEGETEETLPPDTPDAIKPEEFTLPEPESTDDNGDDGHTEIIDIRVSVARVRRVR